MRPVCLFVAELCGNYLIAAAIEANAEALALAEVSKVVKNWVEL